MFPSIVSIELMTTTENTTVERRVLKWATIVKKKELLIVEP